jgi:hypothetical protein
MDEEQHLGRRLTSLDSVATEEGEGEGKVRYNRYIVI